MKLACISWRRAVDVCRMLKHIMAQLTGPADGRFHASKGCLRDWRTQCAGVVSLSTTTGDVIAAQLPSALAVLTDYQHIDCYPSLDISASPHVPAHPIFCSPGQSALTEHSTPITSTKPKLKRTPPRNLTHPSAALRPPLTATGIPIDPIAAPTSQRCKPPVVSLSSAPTPLPNHAPPPGPSPPRGQHAHQQSYPVPPDCSRLRPRRAPPGSSTTRSSAQQQKPSAALLSPPPPLVIALRIRA